MQSIIVNHLVILGSAAIFGLLTALPVLLPPLRRRARRSGRARKMAILVCGLLALALAFTAWNYLKAVYAFVWIAMGGGSTEDIQDNEPFMREMWLRESVPPFTRPVCYTQDVRGCRVADYFVEHANYTSDWAWFNYVFTLIFSLAAGLCGALWARLFTRPAPDGAS